MRVPVTTPRADPTIDWDRRAVRPSPEDLAAPLDEALSTTAAPGVDGT